MHFKAQTVIKGADLQTSDEVCQGTFLVLLQFFVV